MNTELFESHITRAMKNCPATPEDDLKKLVSRTQSAEIKMIRETKLPRNARGRNCEQ